MVRKPKRIQVVCPLVAYFFVNTTNRNSIDEPITVSLYKYTDYYPEYMGHTRGLG